MPRQGYLPSEGSYKTLTVRIEPTSLPPSEGLVSKEGGLCLDFKNHASVLGEESQGFECLRPDHHNL